MKYPYFFQPLLLLLCLVTFVALPSTAKELTPYRHGYEQGRDAGGREGRERAVCDAEPNGEADGYAIGLTDGRQILLDETWARGLAQGQADGLSEGRSLGRQEGLELGQRDGQLDGEREGFSSADKAAQLAVGPRAQSDGAQRASSASPETEGQRSGETAGLERAKREANVQDYSKARKDYHDKQFAEPVEETVDVRQAPLALAPSSWQLANLAPQASATLFGRHSHSCPSPDWRYLRYGSDNEEFQRGFREGYAEGFRDRYTSQYDWKYQLAYDSAYRIGISRATVGNLQATADEAYQEGFHQGRQTGHDGAQTLAHKEAYGKTFESVFAKSYADSYPRLEAQHYKVLEEKAFQAIYGPPYQAAFAVAERRSFEQNYPAQAKLAYAQGWKAEAKDFKQRPVRLIAAWVIPTDVPGVRLLSLKMRNFSDSPVAGDRVRVSLGAQTSRLYHAVPAQTEMVVTGLLRIHQELPEKPELFAVIESDGQKLPLGTVQVTASKP